MHDNALYLRQRDIKIKPQHIILYTTEETKHGSTVLWTFELPFWSRHRFLESPRNVLGPKSYVM